MQLPIPEITTVALYTCFSAAKASQCSHPRAPVTPHTRTTGVTARTLSFCQQTQPLLKEGQKHSEQYEVLGKPVHHIGLNREEL